MKRTRDNSKVLKKKRPKKQATKKGFLRKPCYFVPTKKKLQRVVEPFHPRFCSQPCLPSHSHLKLQPFCENTINEHPSVLKGNQKKPQATQLKTCTLREPKERPMSIDQLKHVPMHVETTTRVSSRATHAKTPCTAKLKVETRWFMIF